MKTRLIIVPLSFKGLATKHATAKWSISHVKLSLKKMTSEIHITLNLVTGPQEHGKLMTVENCRDFRLYFRYCLSSVYNCDDHSHLQDETGWTNGKMFGYQAVFDDVWSPRISFSAGA